MTDWLIWTASMLLIVSFGLGGLAVIFALYFTYHILKEINSKTERKK